MTDCGTDLTCSSKLPGTQFTQATGMSPLDFIPTNPSFEMYVVFINVFQMHV